MVEDRAWSEVSVELMMSAVPWRTFRWFKGQRHYSGIYWPATTNDHVIYESRLELARLLFADFDPAVRHIVAQPFLLKAVLEGKVRKHVPDYLLITGQGPVVVDVKPGDHPGMASRAVRHTSSHPRRHRRRDRHDHVERCQVGQDARDPSTSSRRRKP